MSPMSSASLVGLVRLVGRALMRESKVALLPFDVNSCEGLRMSNAIMLVQWL